MSIKGIPLDILPHVFSYLNPAEAAPVSKSWREASQEACRLILGEWEDRPGTIFERALMQNRLNHPEMPPELAFKRIRILLNRSFERNLSWLTADESKTFQVERAIRSCNNGSITCREFDELSNEISGRRAEQLIGFLDELATVDTVSEAVQRLNEGLPLVLSPRERAREIRRWMQQNQAMMNRVTELPGGMLARLADHRVPESPPELALLENLSFNHWARLVITIVGQKTGSLEFFNAIVDSPQFTHLLGLGEAGVSFAFGLAILGDHVQGLNRVIAQPAFRNISTEYIGDSFTITLTGGRVNCFNVIMDDPRCRFNEIDPIRLGVAFESAACRRGVGPLKRLIDSNRFAEIPLAFLNQALLYAVGFNHLEGVKALIESRRRGEWSINALGIYVARAATYNDGRILKAFTESDQFAAIHPSNLNIALNVAVELNCLENFNTLIQSERRGELSRNDLALCLNGAATFRDGRILKAFIESPFFIQIPLIDRKEAMYTAMNYNRDKNVQMLAATGVQLSRIDLYQIVARRQLQQIKKNARQLANAVTEMLRRHRVISVVRVGGYIFAGAIVSRIGRHILSYAFSSGEE